MGRVAIIGVAIFWLIVTAGSLVWEVADPASLSTDKRTEALPAGLSDSKAAEPTLAELTPGLRVDLRKEIAGGGGQPALSTPAPEPSDAAMPPVIAESSVPPQMPAPTPLAASPAGLPDEKTIVVATTPVSNEPVSPAFDLPPPRPGHVSSDTASAALAPPPKGPSARPPVNAAAASDPRIVEAQTLLASLGYRIGSIDGRSGPQTQAAIKAYQKKAGLKASGRIDEALLTRLRSDVRASAREPAADPAASGFSPPPPRSLAGRILGGVQRLIGHDFDSTTAPQALTAYCQDRGDEVIYDRGLDRMRSCAEVAGGSKFAFRPLPGDR